MKRQRNKKNLILILGLLLVFQIFGPFKVKAAEVFDLTIGLGKFENEQISNIELKLWKFDKITESTDYQEALDIINNLKTLYNQGKLEETLGQPLKIIEKNQGIYSGGINISGLDSGYYIIVGKLTGNDGKIYRSFNALSVPINEEEGFDWYKEDKVVLKFTTDDRGKVILKKIDDEKNSLEGVGFRLLFHPDHPLADGEIDKAIPISKAEDGSYIYDPIGGKPTDLFTNSQGLIEVKNLPVGKYIFREVSPKDGYTIKEKDTIFEIIKDQVIELEVINTPGGGFNFKKIDSKTGQPLKDASFSVMIKEGDSFKTVKDKDGKDIVLKSGPDGTFSISGLPYGTYYLWELAPPEGFRLLSQPVKFVVEKGSTGLVLEIENQPGTPPPEYPPETPNPPPENPHEPPEFPETPPEFPENPPEFPTPPPEGPVEIPKTGDITIIIMSIVGIVLVSLGRYFIKEDKKAHV